MRYFAGKYCKCFLLLTLMILLLAPAQVTQSAPNDNQHGASTLWQSIASGIDYREFYLTDPNHLYVARMERSNTQVTLESSIGQGRLSGGTETVSQMAERYDQSINYWGEEWGRRSQVAVAINGYFYNTETGVPWQGQVQSGWYAKRFDDHENGSGFAWTLQRDAFIGGCVLHRPADQIVTHVASGQTRPIDGINIPRGENELIVYTSHYDANTLTDDSGVEMLVAMSRPMMIFPEPAMITGTIIEIRDQAGSTPIPFDQVVLSASGSARQELLNRLQVGDQVGFSHEIRHYESDCLTPRPESWAKTYASVGSSFHFLRKGKIQSFEDLGAVLRNPRTAIAFNQDYIFFIVVDGRDPYRSVGMSIVELAAFAKNTLGAVNGVALDGGGSSTMVINGNIVNNPNADLNDAHHIYLPLTIHDGQPEQPQSAQFAPPATSTTPDGASMGSTQTDKIERAVANGMLMVVVLPREQSNFFTPGAGIITTGSTEIHVRLGPGNNYAILRDVSVGTPGVISDHLLNGVLAKGKYWWKVDFSDFSGWVSEERLAAISGQ